MDSKLNNLLKVIAKAFNYPESLVKEAYLVSNDKSMDTIIEYCERKNYGKKEETEPARP